MSAMLFTRILFLLNVTVFHHRQLFLLILFLLRLRKKSRSTKTMSENNAENGSLVLRQDDNSESKKEENSLFAWPEALTVTCRPKRCDHWKDSASDSSSKSKGECLSDGDSLNGASDSPELSIGEKDPLTKSLLDKLASVHFHSLNIRDGGSSWSSSEDDAPSPPLKSDNRSLKFCPFVPDNSPSSTESSPQINVFAKGVFSPHPKRFRKKRKYAAYYGVCRKKKHGAIDPELVYSFQCPPPNKYDCHTSQSSQENSARYFYRVPRGLRQPPRQSYKDYRKNYYHPSAEYLVSMVEHKRRVFENRSFNDGEKWTLSPSDESFVEYHYTPYGQRTNQVRVKPGKIKQADPTQIYEGAEVPVLPPVKESEDADESGVDQKERDETFLPESFRIQLDESESAEFTIVEGLGRGTFGEVYRAIEKESGKEFALKVAKQGRSAMVLDKEFDLLKVLDFENIPMVFGLDTIGDFRVMVMECLGPNLAQLMKLCGGYFDFKTITMLLHQMVNALEWLHLDGFVHRDLKPENFCMGAATHGDKEYQKVYLTDFGLCDDFQTHRDGLKERRRVKRETGDKQKKDTDNRKAATNGFQIRTEDDDSKSYNWKKRFQWVPRDVPKFTAKDITEWEKLEGKWRKGIYDWSKMTPYDVPDDDVNRHSLMRWVALTEKKTAWENKLEADRLEAAYETDYSDEVLTESEEEVDFVGNPKFASRNALRGGKTSPKDDVESLCYVILYLYVGSLPWDEIRIPKNQGMERRLQMEKIASLKESPSLANWKHLESTAFQQFLSYVRGSLWADWNRKDEYIAYRCIKRWFREEMENRGLDWDYKYDWIRLAEKREEILEEKGHTHKELPETFWKRATRRMRAEKEPCVELPEKDEAIVDLAEERGGVSLAEFCSICQTHPHAAHLILHKKLRIFSEERYGEEWIEVLKRIEKRLEEEEEEEDEERSSDDSWETEEESECEDEVIETSGTEEKAG